MGHLFSVFHKKRCRSPEPDENDDVMIIQPHKKRPSVVEHSEKQATEWKPPSEIHGFAFLEDQCTVRYIENSRVMFVLRGLPGSGKSTIATAIAKTFKDTVVCSADDYFMNNGVYEFDTSGLKEAHQQCQEKATSACSSGVSHVVIDNTNVKIWEMKKYFHMAKDFQYFLVLVEPRTTWKFDANELKEKSTHGIDLETIERRLEMWEIVIPLYYGWFLNEIHSEGLTREAQNTLRCCLDNPAFFEDFKKFSQAESIEDCLRYYRQDKLFTQGKTLHCTAKYCKRGDVPGSYEYATDAVVVDSIGKCFPICVVGFVMTPQTFGARVRLTEDELVLWGNEEVFDSPNNSPNTKNSLSTSNHVRVDKQTEMHQTKSYTSALGCRAHVTLGCADGVTPVTTGIDLLDIVRCEHESLEYTTFRLSQGKLRNYGEGRWVFYADSRSTFYSLFSGFY